MQDVMTRLIDVPMARMFVLAGIIFLLVAVLGRIEGKIEPGNIGRIGATIVGILLMAAGLTMYFIEGDALRAGMRESALLARPAAEPLRSTSATPVATAATIRVVAGTWGRNCNAKTGNASAPLALACDGRVHCDYRFEASSIEDPAPNCEKDYAAEWKCGTAANVYSVSVPAAELRSSALRLACAGG